MLENYLDEDKNRILGFKPFWIGLVTLKPKKKKNLRTFTDFLQNNKVFHNNKNDINIFFNPRYSVYCSTLFAEFTPVQIIIGPSSWGMLFDILGESDWPRGVVGGGNTRCKTTKIDISLILHVNSSSQLGKTPAFDRNYFLKSTFFFPKSCEYHGNILTIILVIFPWTSKWLCQLHFWIKCFQQ